MPDADDPPYETEGRGVGSCSVSSSIFLRLRFGMTDDTGSLQYASHSWILGRMSLDCISQCTIDSLIGCSQTCGSRRVGSQQGFDPPPTCFAVSLLSPWPILKYGHPTFTETPLFEVCSAKVGPRYFDSISTSPGRRSTISAASPFRSEHRMHCRCHPETMERLACRVLCPRPISPTQ